MQERKIASEPVRRIDRVCGLIDHRSRHIAKCYFCSKTESVKYKVDVYDSIVGDIPFKASCCNRCVAVIPHKQ